MSREQQAIDAVKAVTPEGSKFKVTGTIDNVMDGTLVFVEFSHSVDVWNEKYALFRPDSVTVIANSQELTTAFSQWVKQPWAIRVLRLLAEPPIMSAVISVLVILAAVGFMLLNRAADLPAWLGAAIAGVFAFYVGTRTQKT